MQEIENNWEIDWSHVQCQAENHGSDFIDYLYFIQVTMMHRTDYASIWEDFNLKCVCTSYVKIEALTVHSTYNNGFREIHLLARI